jgi:hypothetical protein
LRQSLDGSDRLVIRKNLEISELNFRLATATKEISERDTEIEKLESDIVRQSPTQSENSATVGTDLSKVEAADLLNQLKTRRKKSKADLADMGAVLDVLAELET